MAPMPYAVSVTMPLQSKFLRGLNLFIISSCVFLSFSLSLSHRAFGSMGVFLSVLFCFALCFFCLRGSTTVNAFVFCRFCKMLLDVYYIMQQLEYLSML